MAISVFYKIEVGFEKFLKGTETDVEKFAVAFEKIFKNAPNAVQLVENFLSEVSPLVVDAAEIVDPVIEPEVVVAISTAQGALAALQAALTNAVSGGSVVGDLQNLATSVPSVLGAVKVKNPLLQASITKVVNYVVGEVKVLLPAAEAWVAQAKTVSTQVSATAAKA